MMGNVMERDRRGVSCIVLERRDEKKKIFKWDKERSREIFSEATNCWKSRHCRLHHGEGLRELKGENMAFLF